MMTDERNDELNDELAGLKSRVHSIEEALFDHTEGALNRQIAHNLMIKSIQYDIKIIGVVLFILILMVAAVTFGLIWFVNKLPPVENVIDLAKFFV